MLYHLVEKENAMNTQSPATTQPSDAQVQALKKRLRNLEWRREAVFHEIRLLRCFRELAGAAR